MKKDTLIAAGIDYNKGVERCMNNVAFYERMLTQYAADSKRIDTIKQNFSSKDYAGLEISLHDLKGVCGNLSIMPVFEAATVLMKQLRSRGCEMPDFADAFAVFVEEHNKAVAAINNSI